MRPDEIPAIARLWHDAWHEAHAAHVPTALTALRTAESFRARLGGWSGRVRVVERRDVPAGFCAITRAQVDQLFLAPEVRGSGAALALLRDGERRLAARGVRRATLACIPQNRRALAFYIRAGWRQGPRRQITVAAPDGPFPLTAIVLSRALNPRQVAGRTKSARLRSP